MILSLRQTLCLSVQRVLVRRCLAINTVKMEKCEVAVCQFTATHDKKANLQIVKKLVNSAAEKNAKVVFLPEGTDFISKQLSDIQDLSEPLTSTLMGEYKNLAKDKQVWLSIGGFHEKENNKCFNSHVLIDDSGKIVSVYRKIHLFDVSIPEKNVLLRESDSCTAGTQILEPILSPAGKLALGICYDVRFPELSIIQRKLGAEILTFPSAFTNATGEVHWEVLLRSRAIENQCFVIAAAQYGKHNEKRISYGQSMIINPWGRILAECPKYSKDCPINESIAIATLDLNVLRSTRESMPVFGHRRNDLYSLKLLNNKKEIDNGLKYKFAEKDIPARTVFYQTDLSFAFTNIRCVVPGHVLVSSRRVAKRLADLTLEEQSDLFLTTCKVQKVLEEKFNLSSSTICIQDGKFAGQTVPHVHIHILPRRQGDFEENDEIYDCLAKHDRDSNTQPVRDLSEMVEEADNLRTYFY